MGLFPNNSCLRLQCLMPKHRLGLIPEEVGLSARLFPRDQPVRKHKPLQLPAGCCCCQFQDNKWFRTEQNSNLRFHRAIKAVDIVCWHTARVNTTYCRSFHPGLSSGRSTTTDTMELYPALEELSGMTEKHFNYILQHITHCILRSYSQGGKPSGKS